MKLRLAALSVLIALTGCAGLDDAMTPGMKVMKNDFNNTIILRQPPVIASRPIISSSDNPHELGFEWNTGTPDVVYFTAVVPLQILNIYEADFIADDQRINGIELASAATVYDVGQGGVMDKRSSRRFKMPLSEFRKLARARIVKMKVSRDTDFSTSRFGQDYPDETASRRIVEFVKKIDEYRAH